MAMASGATNPAEQVVFACPVCRRSMGAAAERAGESVQCIGCGAGLIVPAPASPASPIRDDDPADPGRTTAPILQLALVQEPSTLPARERKGQAPATDPELRRRDVLLPRFAVTAWAVFALLGLASAFASGLLIGHYLWR